MHQTSYRSALGGQVSRPPTRGVRGYDSRVQPTAWLLAHVAQPASASATPSQRFRTRRQYGHPGAFSGINSRVQDTAWLLSHIAQGAPATARSRYRRSDGSLGVLDPITQGIVIGMGTDWAIRMMTTDPQLEELERQARLEKAARELNDPMSDRGVVGRDRFIYIDPNRFRNNMLSPRSGLGQLTKDYRPEQTFESWDPRNPLSSTQWAGGAASAAVTIPATAIASGSSLASSATWLAAAGGPIGLAVLGVTTALTLLFSRKKPGQKRATTEIVDDVEPMLQKNLSAYMAGPHTVSSQRQALANFDAGWDYVVKSCGIAEMGTPGKWCVDDRKSGGKWDWFARYYDPIANDPDVVPDPTPQSMGVDPYTGQPVYATSGGTTDMMPLVIAAALAFVAFQMA